MNKLKNRVTAVFYLLMLMAVPVAAPAADDTAAMKADIAELKKQVQDAREWRRSESVVHLAGYGSVTYTDAKLQNGAFTGVQFAPIFHYQYKDLMMLESELEFETDSDGETETKLEYLALDLFLNDYVTLVAGKFLSPIGQFRQNLHPSWINKLPSAPPGFGHDGAAPVSEVGLQLRGGFPIGGARGNYAVYVVNGPELEADAGEIEAIEAEGVARDQDGNKVIGGRLGIIPIPRLEIGISAASGEVTVTTDGGVAITGDPDRNYDAAGVDFAYQVHNFDFRGESVRQKAAAAAGSVAPGESDWKVWYVQAAYQFRPSKWEIVLRRTDFDSPHANRDQKQTVFGINYLFAPNVIAKLAFERNQGQTGAPADNNRVQAQFAYGF